MTETGRAPTPLLILDACVLIDYIKAKPKEGMFRTWRTDHVGMGLLLELVRSVRLDHKGAVDIVRQIHADNPHHISTKVIVDFEKKLPSS